MLLLLPLLVYPALITAPRPLESAALYAPTRHVRTANTDAGTALREGYHRSLTFASLVDRLQASDVVVYVSVVPQLPAPLRARSTMSAGTPYERYVWSEIARGVTPDETIALVAHELRHALEIADAEDVIDQTGMERLYRRIGTRSGPGMFETEDAIETEWRVKKELRTRAVQAEPPARRGDMASSDSAGPAKRLTAAPRWSFRALVTGR